LGWGNFGGIHLFPVDGAEASGCCAADAEGEVVLGGV
jgi:hypothetical protein